MSLSLSRRGLGESGARQGRRSRFKKKKIEKNFVTLKSLISPIINLPSLPTTMSGLAAAAARIPAALLVDSYKSSHFMLYPDDCEEMQAVRDLWFFNSNDRSRLEQEKTRPRSHSLALSLPKKKHSTPASAAASPATQPTPAASGSGSTGGWRSISSQGGIRRRTSRLRLPFSRCTSPAVRRGAAPTLSRKRSCFMLWGRPGATSR